MSSVELRLDAEVRTAKGKGASRRLRRAKKIPAILYGAYKDTVALTVDEEQVQRLMREETFFSQLIDVHVDGEKPVQVILKDLQRHPFKPLVSHMDLLRVKAGEKMRQTVPIHLLNEESAVGVKQGGGVVHRNMIEVEVECLPQDLPTHIELDIADLDVDEARHLSDLIIPANVVLPNREDDPEQDPAVVSIHIPRAVIEDEDLEAEEVAEEGAEEKGEGESEASREDDTKDDER